jgi:hypothetical protein
MASKFVRYFSSKKFRKDMKKVGSEAIPYGNSTPSGTVFQIVADSYKKNEGL